MVFKLSADFSRAIKRCNIRYRKDVFIHITQQYTDTFMKKILFILSLVSFSLVGIGTASAQYYTNTNMYSYGNYTYSNPSYGNYSSYSYPGYSYPNYTYSNNYSYSNSAYYGGVGSYTIGCTTYYYNTRTGAQLYTSNICNTYNTNYSYNYQYQYPSYNYTYPSTSQYCTYGYYNGSWSPCVSHSIFNSYNSYNGYQNYLNCYYNQYGQYVCY